MSPQLLIYEIIIIQSTFQTRLEHMKSKPYDPEFEKTKQQLYYIFTYYCSFADRENYEILKIQNYRRMLTDAQIMQKGNQNTEFDLLYSQCKKNNSGIDFDTFLQIIPEFAKIVQPTQQQNTVRKIVQENLHALFQFIIENTDFGFSIRYLEKSYFSENCFILLRSLSQTLYKVYASYFEPNAIKIIKQRAQIFKKLTNFTKNFEITPQLMTKTQSFVFFNHVLDEQAESVYKQWFEQDKKSMQVFRYFHFLKFILIVSLAVNKKIIGVEISQFRKLVNLLQMFQISSGFSKICKSQQINLRLIPNPKLIKQLQYRGNIEVNLPSLGSSPLKKQAQNSQQSINDKFLQNYSELRKKFISYCLHGQTIGSSTLSHKKAINIIRAMRIGLKQSQIQVYLASAGKSLQFESFILVLQRISQKQAIQVQEIINKFLGMSLDSQIQHEKLRTSRANSKFSRTQYRNCISMVQFAQNFLRSAFVLESEPNKKRLQQLSFISLSSYLKIMHDFQISPLYLNKQSLIEIFRQSIKKSYDFMTFNEFKDSFIISIPYLDLLYKQNQQNFAPQTKMIVMFERINESRGAKKISKSFPDTSKQDYLVKFRFTFKEFYPQQIPQNNKDGQQKLRLLLQ